MKHSADKQGGRNAYSLCQRSLCAGKRGEDLCLDRGFLFGDGIYEVASVLGGKLIDFPAHIARLHRSANELGMRFDVSDEEILAIHRELVSRNEVEEGVVYMQMTRGALTAISCSIPKN
jgi:branched-subunit amino acid aminotransferase/4-amino-4-deoxychorismate lyase